MKILRPLTRAYTDGDNCKDTARKSVHAVAAVSEFFATGLAPAYDDGYDINGDGTVQAKAS